MQCIPLIVLTKKGVEASECTSFNKLPFCWLSWLSACPSVLLWS